VASAGTGCTYGINIMNYCTVLSGLCQYRLAIDSFIYIYINQSIKLVFCTKWPLPIQAGYWFIHLIYANLYLPIQAWRWLHRKPLRAPLLRRERDRLAAAAGATGLRPVRPRRGRIRRCACHIYIDIYEYLYICMCVGMCVKIYIAHIYSDRDPSRSSPT